MQTYVATVRILVAAPTLEDACDVIAAALNDPINTAFVDWGYIPTADDNPPMPVASGDGKAITWPTLRADLNAATYYDPTTYVEGSFLQC